jgi:tetratricopeptide (TPR) repeat protein
MLAQARTAAREGRHEQAEHGYLAIIQRYPDSYDAFGELGDLYYTQGRRDEAASSYYQAALRLLEAGYVREAEHLQEVIRPLSQTLATSLETKLTSQKRH